MRKSSKLFTILSAAMCVTALGAAPCYAEEVTINFWHHYSEQSAENETLNNVLIPEFEKENPDIKVNAVSHEWSDLHEKNPDKCQIRNPSRCSTTRQCLGT